jgi:Uma2 family endonuclease
MGCLYAYDIVLVGASFVEVQVWRVVDDVGRRPKMAIDPKNWDWDEKPHPGGPMTEDEYLCLDRMAYNAKYEYIDGVARLMAGGTWAHDQISFNTRVALKEHFRTGPCFVSGSDMRVLIKKRASGKNLYVYPDVTLSCNVADRKPTVTIIEMPRLVVEVLSVGTEAKDRGPKLKNYQICPWIYEIILISQFAPYVEVWERQNSFSELPPIGATPEDMEGKPEDKWRYSHYGPGEMIKLEALDIEIAVDDLYRDIDFSEMTDY